MLNGISDISPLTPKPIFAPRQYDSESIFDSLPLVMVVAPLFEQEVTAAAHASVSAAKKIFFIVFKFLLC